MSLYSLISEYSVDEVLARLRAYEQIDQISAELSISEDMRQALSDLNALIARSETHDAAL